MAGYFPAVPHTAIRNDFCRLYLIIEYRPVLMMYGFEYALLGAHLGAAGDPCRLSNRRGCCTSSQNSSSVPGSRQCPFSRHRDVSRFAYLSGDACRRRGGDDDSVLSRASARRRLVAHRGLRAGAGAEQLRLRTLPAAPIPPARVTSR
jgi:hypothetical protein